MSTESKHPRDLFDVKLLQNEGEISPGIRHAFVAYVAVTSRPMAEILAPQPAALEGIYENQFIGMPAEPDRQIPRARCATAQTGRYSAA